MKSIVEYAQREDDHGGFWIDITVDGITQPPVGPFFTSEVCDAAYAHLLDMMRSIGAIDMPPINTKYRN